MSEKSRADLTTGKTASRCQILWRTSADSRCDEIYAAARRANLLQSLTYGQTLAKLNHQRVRRGIIVIEGHDAGMVQVLEAGIFNNMIHAAHLDRGPLWLDPYGTPEDFADFLKALRTAYPKRPGRRLRLIPECRNNSQNTERLKTQGFKQSSQPYQTLWLDITPPQERIRAGLRPKWRGHLNKALRQNLEILWDTQGKLLPWFIAGYDNDKTLRNYKGPSLKTLTVLTQEFLHRKNALIGRATLDGQPLAGVLIFCHGRSATYQAGWTTPSGRECRAHNALLWDAVEKLKKRAINDFDLGGIDAEHAAGIKNFKEGMGAELCETPGLWL